MNIDIRYKEDAMPAPPSTARKGRDWLTFDRYDRWGLAGLLGLISVGAVAAYVVAPLARWASGSGLRVPFFSEVDVPALEGTGLRHGLGDYHVVIPDPTAGQRLLDLLPGLGWLALALACCWLVLRVMGDIGRGDPFQPGNVRRLRLLAALLVLGWPVVASLEAMTAFAILAELDLEGVGPRAAFTFPLLPMLVGVVVALLAEAFKAGSRLRDDVDGLV
ncbi:MAG: DUF2975 domain-containing protein [Nocardioides sp.]